MRVHLRAKAEFYFPVTAGLVAMLIQLSKHHYDGACQRASARVGRPLWPGSTSVHPQNGLLTIWLDRFEGKGLDETTEAQATWNDLDLVSKICENPPDNRPGYNEVQAFRKQIKAMLDFAGPKIMAEWKEEFDV